jgi:hypothetical protein
MTSDRICCSTAGQVARPLGTIPAFLRAPGPAIASENESSVPDHQIIIYNYDLAMIGFKFVLRDFFISYSLASEICVQFQEENKRQSLGDWRAPRSHRVNTAFINPLLNAHCHGEKIHMSCGERSDCQKWTGRARENTSSKKFANHQKRCLFVCSNGQ